VLHPVSQSQNEKSVAIVARSNRNNIFILQTLLFHDP
jgi:hypothetical protein